MEVLWSDEASRDPKGEQGLRGAFERRLHQTVTVGPWVIGGQLGLTKVSRRVIQAMQSQHENSCLKVGFTA